MTAPGAGRPLSGVRVVEVAVGVTDLGLGPAGGMPGMLLADLGAEVVRVVPARAPAIDADVPWGRAWHRDKRILATDDRDVVAEQLRGADIGFVYGPEELVEGRGLGWRDLREEAPGLVHVRCRPSRTSAGSVADFGLLVEARSGLCTQLAGHRPGPIFVDVRTATAGTAFLLTTTALALLRRRVLTGSGGWGETSLYDGMLASLGCMVGRSERATPDVENYWAKGSTYPNFLYRCADGELVQVWFGGKGMYRALIDVLGDEPSEAGYYTDQRTGHLQERAVRWRSFFAQRPRDAWIADLRRAGVACEPVHAPGEALAEPHLTEVGLAVPRSECGHDDVVVGSPLSVAPLAGSAAPAPAPRPPSGRGLLAGLRVLDFSAFVAGPLAAEILADLGAEVVKVEPVEGEAMRAAAYAVGACQRGKRSLAMDITAEEARPVVERLIRWADVVLHNFRVGVSQRLGIDEETVGRLNPGAVYCHASAFGATGPRARFPGNDALMQALTGLEVAAGGAGNDPLAATWVPIDMAGGWCAAVGVLAGLYRAAAGGGGQRVATSLLGTGMLLHSGVFLRDGALVPGPALDGGQTGYGPGYRIYRAGNGDWFALVVPDEAAWARLGRLVDGLPSEYAPLRGSAGAGRAEEAERVLERAFATAPAGEWAGRLRAAGALVEPIVPVDRDGFRRGVLDDPVNRELGRVVSYDTADWGRFEQIGPLLRTGPEPGTGPRLMLPGIGEQSVEVLAELGVPAPDIEALLSAGVAFQGPAATP
ncbi:CoA transferase [Trujillonella endophytica]|uniref:Crotonobetainyl-CoA:carnitine CoA-transferase CaiB n=1 Tax=Trujillonella endophytica TaxID=673521 RepID=A0A1H8V5U5_9ACTN|nr:CoA transferase [Trujillella endophytica]SEP10637.1 Crotonobetainyl-CoA:carnitine CoA-transferase CaiB [Trujillella endophytica]